MQDADARALRDGIAYGDQWLDYRREFRDIPGLVVAIRHHGELMLSKAYGCANLENNVAMNTSHIFRIASHSKTFTATAIMQLVEQTRLRLDDRASAILPWLSSEITIRQLLNHTSGITRDSRDADFWQIERPFPDRDQLREIASESLVLEPNLRFKYSNIGYGLLGLVIEAISGSTYNQYVTEHIVQPLGLRNTGPEVDPGLADRLVTGYSRARFGLPRQPASGGIQTRALSPATGFYSTADDLSAYATAHCMGDNRLLTDASKREMQHAYWTIDQADEGYGLGFAVRTIGQRRMVGHGGGFPGQSTRTLIDPDDQLVVVVCSNTNASDGLAAPLADTLLKILDFALGHAGEPQTLQDAFTGRFANAWGVADIATFGSTLKALSPEADNPVERPTDLHVIDENTLRIGDTNGYGSPGETVSYERDGAGQIARVRIGGTTFYPADVFRERAGSA